MQASVYGACGVPASLLEAGTDGTAQRGQGAGRPMGRCRQCCRKLAWNWPTNWIRPN